MSDFNNLCQDLLFPRSYKPRQNIFVLAGTRDAENICAVAEGATVLNREGMTCIIAFISLEAIESFHLQTQTVCLQGGKIIYTADTAVLTFSSSLENSIFTESFASATVPLRPCLAV